MRNFFLLFVYSSSIFLSGNCQENNKAENKIDDTRTYGFQLGVSDGFIFAQSEIVANIKGSKPFGAEGGVSWIKYDSANLNKCKCLPKNGITLSYFDLDNKIYGRSISASYYMEPLYRIGNRLFFSYKGAVGLAYLNKPHDTIRNPENFGYSRSVNFYLVLGTALWFKINDQWWINGNFNFQHVSNGGLKQPNSGINWPTAGIVISHQNKPVPNIKKQKIKNKYWKPLSPRFDIYAMGIGVNIPDESSVNHLYPIVGMGIKGSRQVSGINALSLSSEIIYDPGHKADLKKDSINIGKLRAAALFGNEFLLGKFIFSQRIGAYFINQTNFPRILHRWGLDYRINRQWATGFNLLAHGKAANFFDLRLIYSWQKRYK